MWTPEMVARGRILRLQKPATKTIDDAYVRRTKEDRRRATAAQPKCKCGNCLSLDRSQAGIDVCPTCEKKTKAPEFPPPSSIDTAPTDGTPILVARNDGCSFDYAVVWWTGDDTYPWQADNNAYPDDRFDVWWPLPPFY